MHFFQSILLSALATVALAELQFTKGPPGGVRAGQSVTLEWSGADESAPVTITLQEGTSDNLKTVSTITRKYNLYSIFRARS